MGHGVDTLAGVTCDDEAEATVNRVILLHAKRTLVVADSTNPGADPVAVGNLTDSGVEVLVA